MSLPLCKWCHDEINIREVFCHEGFNYHEGCLKSSVVKEEINRKRDLMRQGELEEKAKYLAHDVLGPILGWIFSMPYGNLAERIATKVEEAILAEYYKWDGEH